MRFLRRLRQVPVGKWIVVAGAAAGVLTFALAVAAGGWNLYTAFMAALGVDLTVMIVVGIAERFWVGRKLQQAGTPGGGNVAFESEIGDVKKALNELNQRVTDQIGDVNKRLYDLDKAVFKDREPGTDTEE